MKRAVLSFCSFVMLTTRAVLPASAVDSASLIYRGMCDASAAAAISNAWFAAADDEQSLLRVYSRAQGGSPVQQLDLSSFLHVNSKSPEVDIEGAASIGDRIYWISSHARNPKGKARPNRHRFFATSTTISNGMPSIQPVGQSYAKLLDDLIADPKFEQFDFATASSLPPESRNALNIEALSAGPDGSLLIGFRNPIPQGKALLVPLLNPQDVIGGKHARFGESIPLNLGGLGIRAMTGGPGAYWIIAGPYHGRQPSYLYAWKGDNEMPRRIDCPALNGLNPEAVELLETNGTSTKLLVLSDDGKLQIGGKECKELKDPNLKYFRSTTIEVIAPWDLK